MRAHRLTPNSRTRRACLAALGLTILVGSGQALAQDSGRELLNSERIASRFGGYGIEVLESSGQVRVSNLYSTQSGERICRTFAVVLYPASIDPAVAEEHATIVAGGSIGAVFTANGWQVRKSNLHYGERDVTPHLAKLMRVPADTRLAEHAYVLDVVKEGRVVEYAALLEVHHPAYLDVAELAAIYGPAARNGREPLLARLLAVATAEAAR